MPHIHNNSMGTLQKLCNTKSMVEKYTTSKATKAKKVNGAKMCGTIGTDLYLKDVNLKVVWRKDRT